MNFISRISKFSLIQAFVALNSVLAANPIPSDKIYGFENEINNPNQDKTTIRLNWKGKDWTSFNSDILIKNFKNLQKFIIENSEFLIEFPSGFENLKNLRDVWIENCPLLNDCSSLSKANQITRLDITHCQGLKNVSTFLENLENLNSLSLNYIELHEFPPSISKLTKLEDLNISNNKIQAFSIDFKNHTALESLDISSNQLNEVPKCIKDLKSLKTLNISSLIRLTDLPDWLKDLPNLSNIYIENCGALKEFPKVILECCNLALISITNCNLEEIPIEIFNLKHLEAAYIDDNPLNEFSDEFKAQLKIFNRPGHNFFFSPNQNVKIKNINEGKSNDKNRNKSTDTSDINNKNGDKSNDTSIFKKIANFFASIASGMKKFFSYIFSFFKN